ncbi:Uncharacterised protein [Pseudomonas mucidolens]|nr:Uncharacterised protein [Pseudomonas mucidolens]
MSMEANKPQARHLNAARANARERSWDRPNLSCLGAFGSLDNNVLHLLILLKCFETFDLNTREVNKQVIASAILRNEPKPF